MIDLFSLIEIDPYLLSLFFITCAVAIITPGPDTFLVLGNSLAHGRKYGLLTALGVCAGYFIHILTAILGITSLILASAFLFTAVKIAGAIYLIYIGISTLINSNSNFFGDKADSSKKKIAFVQGFLGNTLNPKAIIFFIAFIPQFINPDLGNVSAQITIFGALTIIMCLVWYVIVVALASKLSVLLSARPLILTWINRITGVALITLGLRLFILKRPAA